MQMTEDELMTIVGRLYVGTILRDRELARLRLELTQEMTIRHRRDDGVDDLLEDAREAVPAAD